MSADETLREAIERLARDGERTTYSPHTVYVDDIRALLAEHPATPDVAMSFAKRREPSEVAVEERGALADADVLALMREFRPVVEHRRHYGLRIEGPEVYARTLLTSDWLRDHDAALTAKAKAEALREAADEYLWHDAGSGAMKAWLRERADRDHP